MTKHLTSCFLYYRNKPCHYLSVGRWELISQFPSRTEIKLHIDYSYISSLLPLCLSAGLLQCSNKKYTLAPFFADFSIKIFHSFVPGIANTIYSFKWWYGWFRKIDIDKIELCHKQTISSITLRFHLKLSWNWRSKVNTNMDAQINKLWYHSLLMINMM